MSTKVKAVSKKSSKSKSTTRVNPSDQWKTVLAKADCPQCKSKKGHRCIRTATAKGKWKKGDKRNRPHKLRILKATKHNR